VVTIHKIESRKIGVRTSATYRSFSARLVSFQGFPPLFLSNSFRILLFILYSTLNSLFIPVTGSRSIFHLISWNKIMFVLIRVQINVNGYSNQSILNRFTISWNFFNYRVTELDNFGGPI